MKPKIWKGKDSHIRHAKDGTPSQVRPHQQRYHNVREGRDPLKIWEQYSNPVILSERHKKVIENNVIGNVGYKLREKPFLKVIRRLYLDFNKGLGLLIDSPTSRLDMAKKMLKFKDHSYILGNPSEYYWEDKPTRMEYVKTGKIIKEFWKMRAELEGYVQTTKKHVEILMTYLRPDQIVSIRR